MALRAMSHWPSCSSKQYIAAGMSIVEIQAYPKAPGAGETMALWLETKMTLTEDAPSTTQYNQITATNVESGCDIRRLNQNWTPKQRYSELNITFGNRYKNWEAVRVRCAAVQRMTLRQNSSITGADNPENKTVEPGNSEQVAKNFTIFCKIGLQYWNLKFEKVCLKFWMFFSKKGTIVL